MDGNKKNETRELYASISPCGLKFRRYAKNYFAGADGGNSPAHLRALPGGMPVCPVRRLPPRCMPFADCGAMPHLRDSGGGGGLRRMSETPAVF